MPPLEVPGKGCTAVARSSQAMLILRVRDPHVKDGLWNVGAGRNLRKSHLMTLFS